MTNYLHYKRHLSVLDADDTDIESWITVRGNHIPIKKGQSKEEAVKSFLEKKGSESGKNSSKSETKPETNKTEQSKKQNSLKEKMQNIIQSNGKVYGWETEGLEKFAENVEGKSREELEGLHKAYKERVAKLGIWVDTPTKLQEQFLGEVLKEMSESTEKPRKTKSISSGDPRPKNADWETVNDVLFSKYVPKQGKADTLLGEQLRAINRIVYRYENDGDMYGNGYGVETVNAPIKFLQSIYQEKSIPGLSGILSSLKNAAKTNDTMEYEHNIQRLKNVMVNADWETLKKLANTKNDEDMYSFEDNTRYDDEEEEW